jgi:thioredoxin-like negative regulator of GroEL
MDANQPVIALARWPVALAAAGLLVAVWGGFEVHDEAVETPVPRAVRLTGPTPDAVAALETVDGLDAGLRRGVAENRPLLVIFRAAWCRFSSALAQGPLADRRLVTLSRHFVCVTVDADRHAADCARYGVKDFPTVLVATSAGTEIRRWTGCPSADDLLATMSETLPSARMASAEADSGAATR